MSASTIHVAVDVELSVEAGAAWFAGLDDEKQAQFFVEAAKVMEGWGEMRRNMQALFIGAHLRDCECSTAEARELVQLIAETCAEARS